MQQRTVNLGNKKKLLFTKYKKCCQGFAWNLQGGKITHEKDTNQKYLVQTLDWKTVFVGQLILEVEGLLHTLIHHHILQGRHLK